ncbi:hypothetical protein BT69DRAFT_64176, partial [Atractiella rhizophila]
MINRLHLSLRFRSSPGSTFFTPSHHHLQAGGTSLSSGGGTFLNTKGAEKGAVSERTGRSRSISFSSSGKKSGNEEGEENSVGNSGGVKEEDGVKNVVKKDKDDPVDTSASSTTVSSSPNTVQGEEESPSARRPPRSHRRKFPSRRPDVGLVPIPVTLHISPLPYVPKASTTLVDSLWAAHRPLLEYNIR